LLSAAVTKVLKLLATASIFCIIDYFSKKMFTYNLGGKTVCSIAFEQQENDSLVEYSALFKTFPASVYNMTKIHINLITHIENKMILLM
jgi:hypothetical protein